MLTFSKSMREAKIFGGRNLQMNILTGMLGFIRLNLDLLNYDYWIEAFEERFLKLDLEKKYNNDWISSLH